MDQPLDTYSTVTYSTVTYSTVTYSTVTKVTSMRWSYTVPMRLSHRTILTSAAVAAGAALMAFHGPPTPAADEATVIRAARLAQNQALARGDFDVAQRYWAPDISVRAGLGEQVQGKEAYLAAFKSDAVVRYHRVPASITVSPRWPLAFETGTWTGRLASNLAAAPLLTGQYSAQWVKVRNQWQIRSEVFVAIDCNGGACAWPASMP
jgi:ketosteroid isomerase-like protein